ncbi:hypothetical protein QFC21_005196 [Naganishia friedmannii]|uniref:Uncharacterized protein n=1 Tax=Naganishia friedmannii TaxID=89922 RepID=A0ACC2VBL4_9TREE|nr:hypothetical protein QFC21_005196 [Naganishia friedmannii]
MSMKRLKKREGQLSRHYPPVSTTSLTPGNSINTTNINAAIHPNNPIHARRGSVWGRGGRRGYRGIASVFRGGVVMKTGRLATQYGSRSDNARRSSGNKVCSNHTLLKNPGRSASRAKSISRNGRYIAGRASEKKQSKALRTPREESTQTTFDDETVQARSTEAIGPLDRNNFSAAWETTSDARRKDCLGQGAASGPQTSDTVCAAIPAFVNTRDGEGCEARTGHPISSSEPLMQVDEMLVDDTSLTSLQSGDYQASGSSRTGLQGRSAQQHIKGSQAGLSNLSQPGENAPSRHQVASEDKCSPDSTDGAQLLVRWQTQEPGREVMLVTPQRDVLANTWKKAETVTSAGAKAPPHSTAPDSLEEAEILYPAAVAPSPPLKERTSQAQQDESSIETSELASYFEKCRRWYHIRGKTTDPVERAIVQERMDKPAEQAERFMSRQSTLQESTPPSNER